MITPLEIRQQTFKKGLRGYEKEDVANYLNSLSMEWEKMLEENKRLKSTLDKTETELQSIKKVESALHQTLLHAEQNSKSMVENAKEDARLKIQEAEARANEILQSALKDRSRIEREIQTLIAQRNDILQQLQLFLKGQQERLATFEAEEMKQAHKGKGENEGTTASFFETSMEGGAESTIVNDIVEEL